MWLWFFVVTPFIAIPFCDIETFRRVGMYGGEVTRTSFNYISQYQPIEKIIVLVNAFINGS